MCIYASCLLKIFLGSKQETTEVLLLTLATGGLEAGSPAFHPRAPSFSSGQGAKISLQARSLLSPGHGRRFSHAVAGKGYFVAYCVE